MGTQLQNSLTSPNEVALYNALVTNTRAAANTLAASINTQCAANAVSSADRQQMIVRGFLAESGLPVGPVAVGG